MECKTEGCNEKVVKNHVVNELFCFSIPFTNIEIRLWQWVDAEYCETCLIEQREQPQRDAYNNGFDDAMIKAYKENNIFE